MPSIRMKKEKDCKGSVKYSTTDAKAVITNVYVDRSFADPMPAEVTIVVGEPGRQAAGGGSSGKKSKREKREEVAAESEGE